MTARPMATMRTTAAAAAIPPMAASDRPAGRERGGE